MILRFLMAVALCSAISWSANAKAPRVVPPGDEHILPMDDRWVPIPYSTAQPFPWHDMQGMWKAEQGDYTSYFAVRLVENHDVGSRYLQIRQYDGENCKVLASGVGIEKDSKFVIGQVTSRAGNIYRLQLSAFNEQDFPMPPIRGKIPTSNLMVISLGTLQDSVDDMIHMQIVKVSGLITQQSCFEDIGK